MNCPVCDNDYHSTIKLHNRSYCRCRECFHIYLDCNQKESFDFQKQSPPLLIEKEQIKQILEKTTIKCNENSLLLYNNFCPSIIIEKKYDNIVLFNYLCYQYCLYANLVRSLTLLQPKGTMSVVLSMDTNPVKDFTGRIHFFSKKSSSMLFEKMEIKTETKLLNGFAFYNFTF